MAFSNSNTAVPGPFIPPSTGGGGGGGPTVEEFAIVTAWGSVVDTSSFLDSSSNTAGALSFTTTDSWATQTNDVRAARPRFEVSLATLWSDFDPLTDMIEFYWNVDTQFGSGGNDHDLGLAVGITDGQGIGGRNGLLSYYYRWNGTGPQFAGGYLHTTGAYANPTISEPDRMLVSMRFPESALGDHGIIANGSFVLNSTDYEQRIPSTIVPSFAAVGALANSDVSSWQLEAGMVKQNSTITGAQVTAALTVYARRITTGGWPRTGT